VLTLSEKNLSATLEEIVVSRIFAASFGSGKGEDILKL
jgi:hypothetical protein